MIFHIGGGDVSLGPHRLIKGRRGEVHGAGVRGVGHNGGAISDGNARHVGMRRAPPLIRERFVVFFIDDSRNASGNSIFVLVN